MTERPHSSQEGQRKYELHHAITKEPIVTPDQIRELNRWRNIFFRKELIGKDRYGRGYGMVAQRYAAGMLVTATNTGGQAVLTAEHYVYVSKCNSKIGIFSEGPHEPSTETPSVWEVPAIFIFHGHAYILWEHAQELELPITNKAALNGSWELAGETRRLCRDPEVMKKGIIVMGGHRGGIITFGKTADQAGNRMLSCLDRASNLSVKQ